MMFIYIMHIINISADSLLGLQIILKIERSNSMNNTGGC